MQTYKYKQKKKKKKLKESAACLYKFMIYIVH